MNTHDKIVKCRSCGYVGPCDPTCCEHPDYDGATAEEAWQAAIEADRKRGGAPVAHRLLRKNADGEWVTDGRPWCDGVPDADLVKDSEKSGQYRIEYAFAAPQPAEPCASSVSDKTACGSANGDYDPQPAEPDKQHPDDVAVDAFAAAMKAKLKRAREEKGRGGWQDMSATELSAMLREHVEKGDPVDVANLAMMLHQNGQGITPAEPVKVPSDPAVAAIQFTLETDEGIPFLHCWNEGDFDAIRREWPEAPEEVFIGADPMHAETRALLARYTAPQPAEPVKIYIETRECHECGHVGINDAHVSKAACNSCDWTGYTPNVDRCPGCNQAGTMTAACPTCGGRYGLLAEKNITWNSASAAQPAEPVKCIGCEGKPAPENNPCAVCGKEAEPVKVPSDDVLTDALNNLEHDNYEQSYSGYKNRQADVELIRAALAAMGETGREVEK